MAGGGWRWVGVEMHLAAVAEDVGFEGAAEGG